MTESTTDNVILTRLPKLAEVRYELRRFLNFSETESERLGIAAQQYQLLQVIGAVPQGNVASISYIAERMILRHNSTVELVDRAERAGLVKRTSDERDLRRSIVVLTTEGRAVMEQLIVAHLAQLDGETGEALLRALFALREGHATDAAAAAQKESAEAIEPAREG